MYDQGKIWDLTPDGGGPPVQVVVGNPNEAIAAHPERYTRTPPDGSPAADLAKRRADQAAARAEIDKARNAKLAEIAKARQAKIDEIAKKEAADIEAARAKKTADDKKAADESGAVPSREGERAAAEAEASAAAEVAQHEADEKLRALEAGK